MKYALISNNHSYLGSVNYGDHIQSIAASQFLPQIDFKVERDKLNNDYELAKVIMNGWFTYNPENWPPNEKLNPLFISFHLNPTYSDILLKKEENRDFLRKHEPIGCRDFSTLKILEQYNIKAYYSFCLTSTLGLSYSKTAPNNNIIMNDVLYKFLASKIYSLEGQNTLMKIKIWLSNLKKQIIGTRKRNKILNQLIPKKILKESIKISQLVNKNLGEDAITNLASKRIQEYANSKLVITSRIHCALPCLAVGTPVLFVLEGLENPKADMSRLKGILDYVNILSNVSKEKIDTLFGKKMYVFHSSEIDWDNPPKNPNTHLDLTKKLIEDCNTFIED